MSDCDGPRILVSSIGCWNDAVGADTYSSLFMGYDSTKLANLYIREDLPDSDVCNRYFRISESRVIRSVLNRRVETGKELGGTKSLVPDQEDHRAMMDTKFRYERLRRRRRWILLYARELIWKLGRWRTPELDAFIDEFRPEVILFGMEGYIHFNRINRYVVKRSGARAIGYFYDDNFTYKQHPWSMGYRLYRFFQRRDLRKTAKLCSAFFAISPMTQRECDSYFNIQSVLLTKPARLATPDWIPYVAHSPVKMLYTGNLLYGRLDAMELLGRAIDRLNLNGVRVELDLYTTTALTASEAERLGGTIRLREPVSKGDVDLLQRQADVLLFVEAVNGPNRRVARLSFSTKLTDYLQCGRCVFAIGADGTAPMEYLGLENAAICATTEDDVFEQLQRIIEDPGLIAEYGRRAYECARRNHSESDVRRTLCDTILSVIPGRSTAPGD